MKFNDKKDLPKKDDTRACPGHCHCFALGAASCILVGLITGELALWLSIGAGIVIAAGALIASDIF